MTQSIQKLPRIQGKISRKTGPEEKSVMKKAGNCFGDSNTASGFENLLTAKLFISAALQRKNN